MKKLQNVMVEIKGMRIEINFGILSAVKTIYKN